MDLAMEIFNLTKAFPAEEKYSLTDQIRRSSRSVPANISEAWRKRRYPAAFISKLSDADGESAETQTHIETAKRGTIGHVHRIITSVIRRRQCQGNGTQGSRKTFRRRLSVSILELLQLATDSTFQSLQILEYYLLITSRP